MKQHDEIRFKPIELRSEKGGSPMSGKRRFRLSLASVVILITPVVMLASPSEAETPDPTVSTEPEVEVGNLATEMQASIEVALEEYESFEQELLAASIASDVPDHGSLAALGATRELNHVEQSAIELAVKSAARFTREDLVLSSLQYKHPSVKIELESFDQELDAELLEAGAFSDRQALRNPTFVRFIRTASMEIDLTGATEIQGFDPSEPLRSSSVDTFVARVDRNPWNGEHSLVDVKWVTTKRSASDRPIGWGGPAIVLAEGSEYFQSDCAKCGVGLGRERRSSNFLPSLDSQPDSTLEEDSADMMLDSSMKSTQLAQLTSTQKQKVVDYARKHAEDPSEHFKYYGNDCTNFVSQSLQAGGWTTIANHNRRDKLQKDLSSWHYRHLPSAYPESMEWATYSWTGVDEFFEFARNRSGRTWSRGNIWRYVPGEILQADLGNDNDSDKDHSVVYTGKFVQNGKTHVLISYHTNDRKDKDLRWFMGHYPHARYFGHAT